MNPPTPKSYLNWDVLRTAGFVAAMTLVIALSYSGSDTEPNFEMPALMQRAELSLPESPLLQPQQTPAPNSELVSQFKQRVEELKKLEANMMNGELDRFKSTPAGATDPDSIWRGQMMQADKALLEAGLPALNVRKF